jgi:hypothetical protein
MRRKTISKLQLVGIICSTISIIGSFIAKYYFGTIFFGLMLLITILPSSKIGRSRTGRSGRAR